jgi:hypothetical protein
MLHKNAEDLSAYVFIGCHFAIQLQEWMLSYQSRCGPAQKLSDVRCRKKCSTDVTAMASFMIPLS